MNHKEVITQFYTAFQEGDAQKMANCYHQDIVFHDPAFGKLKGEQVSKMWEMLLSNKQATPEIRFSNVEADGQTGSASWTAEYFFGPQKRKVINKIQASFVFQDHKIIEHSDHFSFWKWSSQALGLSGYLLGWSPMMRNKVQRFTSSKLTAFMNQ